MANRLDLSEDARKLLRLHFTGRPLSMRRSRPESLPGRNVEQTRRAYRELVAAGLMEPVSTFALSITHIFSGALPLVNLGQFCDLANPHQDSFGNGAHDLTQYCLGPSSGFGG